MKYFKPITIIMLCIVGITVLSLTAASLIFPERISFINAVILGIIAAIAAQAIEFVIKKLITEYMCAAFMKVALIYEPDKKLKAIRKHVKFCIGGMKNKNIHEWSFECQAYNMAAQAHTAKGDFEKALEVLEKVQGIIASEKVDKPTEIMFSTTLADYYTCMKRFDEAETILNGIDCPADLPQHITTTVKLMGAYLDIRRGQTQNIPAIIADITPKMQELSLQLKRPDLMFDITFLEGLTAKAEGNYAEARKKLEEALAGSKDYRIHREAREELAEN